MTRTPREALQAARDQSAHGPRFGVNECKMRTRLLYGIPSDGSPSAAAAWVRCRFKHTPTTPLRDIPKGALVWWLGGAAGHGHVALYAGGGQVWSTDIDRPGYFDLVPVLEVARRWPSLTLVGWSEDIDGVRVIRPAMGRIGQARRLLRAAAGDESLPAARRARARRGLEALS